VYISVPTILSLLEISSLYLSFSIACAPFSVVPQTYWTSSLRPKRISINLATYLTSIGVTVIIDKEDHGLFLTNIIHLSHEVL